MMFQYFAVWKTMFKNFFLHNESGHTLIEILAVCGIITILATIPVTYMREAKIRANETAALGALNQMAAAYEMYRVVGDRQRFYPHFYSHGLITDTITFHNPEEIWDELIRQRLLPYKYAAYNHNTPNLMAPGYSLSIYPINHDVVDNYSINPWDSYAFALIPFPGSRQPRTMALIHGGYFDHYFTNARAYKTTSTSSDISDARIFTFKDPEPD